MSTYLITGGQGFIGSKIVAATGGKSFDLRSGLDVRDRAKLAEYVWGMDAVFHCAAKISVPESFKMEKEYHSTNVEGTRALAHVAKEHNTKVVFSSSASVYGNTGEIVTEESPTNPMSPYAQNKLDGEKILQEEGIPAVVLRYFNVYGPGQSDEYAGVIGLFIKKALKNEDILIHGDGKQTRDFVYVDDVVDANVLAAKYNKKTFNTFNIASGDSVTVLEMAEKIIELTNSNSEILFGPAREGDIYDSRVDISKARAELGWMPKVKIEDGLKKTIEYYKGL